MEYASTYNVTVVQTHSDSWSDSGGSTYDNSGGTPQTAAWLTYGDSESDSTSAHGYDNTYGAFGHGQSSWSIYRYHSTTTNGNTVLVVDDQESGGSDDNGTIPPGVDYEAYSGVPKPFDKIRGYSIGAIRGVGGATHAGTGFGGQAPYGGEDTLYNTVGAQTTNDLNKAYDYDQITAIANQNGTYSLMEGHPDAAWVTHPSTGYRRSIVGGGGGQGQTDFGYGANSPGAVGFSTNSDATQQNTRQSNFNTGASQHSMGTGTWINYGNGTSTMVPSNAPPSMPPGRAESRQPNCGCVIGPSQGYNRRGWGQTLVDSRMMTDIDLQATKGLAQGLANTAQGLQNTAVSLANVIPWVWNHTATPILGSPSKDYLSSPDWSRNLFVYEDPRLHAFSVNLGGYGATSLTGMGLGKLLGGAASIPVANPLSGGGSGFAVALEGIGGIEAAASASGVAVVTIDLVGAGGIAGASAGIWNAYASAGGAPPARGVDITPRRSAQPGTPMSVDDAIAEVSNGGDVMAQDRDTARRIAEAAGDGPPLWHAPHGPGQCPHFHPTIGGEPTRAHVLY